MRRRSSLATASTVLIALPSPAACERRRGRRAARTWLTSCREWCDNRAPIVPQSAASPASAGSTSMSCHDPIARVDAVTVGIDLPTPLLLGSTEIGRREYAVVTVTTEDGLSGSSYSLTRALPLAAAVRTALAPLLVGADSALIAAAWDRCYRATAPGGRTGILMRGLSLVDIALWDIKAKRAGLPLWAMLGGHRREVPVLVVGGYPRPDRSVAETGELAASYLRCGHPLV